MRGLLSLLMLLSIGSSCAQQPADAPLPDMRQLLLDLDKNEKAVEEQARDYTYHVHVEAIDLDGKGQAKKTTVIDSESLTIQGVRVNRVVARNGKPLTPDETAKENERIDKEVAKAHERREKHESKGEDTDNRGDEMIPASRILELGTFSNPRREMLDGRSTIVLDYAGDPNAKTHNSAEGIIRDLAGVVWIDEADRVLVRGEGHFLNDFKIGGGLIADVKKGSHFEFRATKVNNAAWLPATVSWEGRVRILLFGGFNGRGHLEASDYRRFRTGVTIMPGSHVLDEKGNPIPAQLQAAPNSAPVRPPH